MTSKQIVISKSICRTLRVILCMAISLSVISTLFRFRQTYYQVDYDTSTFPTRPLREAQLNESESDNYYLIMENVNLSIVRRNLFTWTIDESSFCTMIYPMAKILIVVHTSSDHFSRRSIYREMYDKQFYDEMGIVMLFISGLSTNDSINEEIQIESAKYHDIIQQNYIDSYRNLTWKAISWLSYVDNYCPDIEYIIKIDDDVIMNLYGITEYLKQHSAKIKSDISQRNIICGIFPESDRIPHRNNKSKWFVTRDEYEANEYLPYCRGWQYIMTRNTAVDILDAAEGEKFYWIDDYFITGHLGNKINVTFDNIRKLHGNKNGFVNEKALFWLANDKTLLDGKQQWLTIRNKYSLSNNMTIR